MKFCILGILFVSNLALSQEKVAAPTEVSPPAEGATPASVPPATPPPKKPSPAAPSPVPSELLGPESAVSPAGSPSDEGSASENPSSSSALAAQQGGSVKEEYVYDPTGRRDPFMIHKSFQKKAIVSGGGQKTEQNIEILDPLIKIDLDRQEIVGIIWEVANPRALILDQGDPERKVHIVNKRTKIGRNNGYVAAIREGEIVIIETFEEVGIVNQQPKVIKLQPGK
ncbi:MAG: pilus assembly protein PilP [Bdellovibrionales bacterium]|nr:pilus assembly protein PilP [Bdellovibrionales bacterium]